jgi:D-glycero-D-manno-heptose 1,7-bisphosphate phosphatase
MMNKCVFLDRDGVLNDDRADYVYRLEDCIVPEGVAEALQALKKAGYLLIVVTNQAGIAKGLYTSHEVRAIFEYLQSVSGNVLDDLFYCPHHPQYDSASLLRKPDSLMLEKAMAKYRIDPALSWMVGDAERDVLAGKKAGVRTIHITSHPSSLADQTAANLKEAAQFILSIATHP